MSVIGLNKDPLIFDEIRRLNVSRLFSLFVKESPTIEEEQAADPAANDIRVGEESGAIMIVKCDYVNPE